MMRSIFRAFLGCLTGVGSLLALVPGITSVQNPASNIVTGLPNYGIAQGSIFVVYGSQLGPSPIVIAQTLPYQTTLAGTSITVKAGGLTFSPFIIYTSAGQVAAIMPSATVAGPATVQVTYNGFLGSAFNTTIVQSNFGISTLNQSGSGAAVITYPTSTTPFYGIVSGTNSAIPGNTYTMWGTGLGPANSDNNIATNGDLGTNIQVLVGGVLAAVTYRGRSGGPGLDQINFTIPAGLSGCDVSLVVTTASTPAALSNNTTIPIAAGGGNCSDTFGVSPATWSPLLSQSGGINVSFFQVNGNTSTQYPKTGTPTTTTGTQINASFARFTQTQLAAQYQTLFAPAASLGSCIVTLTYPSSGSTPSPNYTGLDSGNGVILNSFTGSTFPLSKQASIGVYQTTTTTLFPTGTYNMTNGTGGPGVGAIGSIPITVPTYPTWTNQTTLGGASIPRNTGLTLTWSGGSSLANAYVDIQGSSPFGLAGTSQIAFDCSAPIASGQFTVPASILSAFPTLPGSLQFGVNVGQFVTVPGINLAAVATQNASSINVNWN